MDSCHQGSFGKEVSPASITNIVIVIKLLTPPIIKPPSRLKKPTDLSFPCLSRKPIAAANAREIRHKAINDPASWVAGLSPIEGANLTKSLSKLRPIVIADIQLNMAKIS